MLKLLKNKYLLTAGAVVVFGLTIALGILYAKDRVALNDILNEKEAVNFAYLDAGVSSDDVISYTAKRDRALGEYVYKINFSSKDATYSYVVDANHGDIISGIKEITGKGNIAQNNTSDNNPSISIHEEKPEDMKKKIDRNAQKTEDKDKDNLKTEDKSDTTENSSNTSSNETDKSTTIKTEDNTKNTATKKPDKTDGGGKKTETSSGKPKKDKNKDKASTGEKSETKTNSPSDTKRYISVDKAKTIALKQAGLTPAMVTFGKAVLKKDDGRVIYEIEFFTSSNEYEYEIDAYNGAILSQDMDAISPSEQTGNSIEQRSDTPKNEDLEKFDDDDDDDKDGDKDDEKDDNDKDDDD